MKKKYGKKSPLTSKPLRNPGESCDKEVSRLINDVGMEYLVASLLVIMLAGHEWLNYFSGQPPQPLIYTFFAVVFSTYCGFRIYQTFKQAKNVRLGGDGEKAIGQYLELLRKDGAEIYHDIPGDGFNIDHVVIDRRGIFVIETKTYSKPETGGCKLRFDGTTITMFGKPLLSDPVVQANAAARWLSEVLEESTGKKWQPKPVILFPGWFIETFGNGNSGSTWVLNPKGFPQWLRSSQGSLKDDEVKMASFHLSRFIRSRAL